MCFKLKYIQISNISSRTFMNSTRNNWENEFIWTIYLFFLSWWFLQKQLFTVTVVPTIMYHLQSNNASLYECDTVSNGIYLYNINCDMKVWHQRESTWCKLIIFTCTVFRVLQRFLDFHIHWYMWLRTDVLVVWRFDGHPHHRQIGILYTPEQAKTRDQGPLMGWGFNDWTARLVGQILSVYYISFEQNWRM